MAANSKSNRKKSDVDDADYENEVYQAFMAGYVKRINESTLRVPVGGVRIGSARYSRLAQINLQSRIITFSRFAIENVPERGRRYLVLHELAHVKVASHNKYFWSLVAEHEPEYKRIGKELEMAFHTNVRDQSRKNKAKETRLPLIRTAYDLDHEQEHLRSRQLNLFTSKEEQGLLYPLDSGIVDEDEYSCRGSDFADQEYTPGLITGGTDLTDELAEDFFDHMYFQYHE